MATRDARAIVNYLKRTRIKQGKSQADVVRAAGIAKSMLSDWESHKKEPGLSNVMRWARALDCHMIVLNQMYSDDKQPQLREVTEYGVTFDKGANAGKIMAPLPVESICYWNKNSRIDITPRLMIRTRLEVAEEVPFRRATDEEIEHWNRKIMAPHVMKDREHEKVQYERW